MLQNGQSEGSAAGESSKPIDIEAKAKGPKIKWRYRSPEQLALTPRTARRNMLLGEDWRVERMDVGERDVEVDRSGRAKVKSTIGGSRRSKSV